MIKVFGHRAILEHWKPASGTRIIQPDTAGQHDVLRWGKVTDVGDGVLTLSMREKLHGRGFEASPIPNLVQAGDRVCFEVNDIMLKTQFYKIFRDGKPVDMMHILQTDLIGRLKGDEVTYENFEILGDFVLIKPHVRNLDDSRILLPGNMPKTADMVYYEVMQVGSRVGMPIKAGQEIIVNHGRVNAIFFSTKSAITGKTENIEYGYVIKDYVHGVVDA